MKYNINYYDMKEQRYVHLTYKDKAKALKKLKEVRQNEKCVCIEYKVDYVEISMFNESTDKKGRNFIYNIYYDEDDWEFLLEYFYCLQNNSEAETGYEQWFETIEELEKFVEEM